MISIIMVTSTHLRLAAALFTAISLVLVTAPFLLHGQMPLDAVEPQKITLGAAVFLGLIMFAGFGVSLGSAVTGFIAFRTRDWLAFAVAVPAPAFSIGFWIYFWVVEGM